MVQVEIPLWLTTTSTSTSSSNTSTTGDAHHIYQRLEAERRGSSPIYTLDVHEQEDLFLTAGSGPWIHLWKIPSWSPQHDGVYHHHDTTTTTDHTPASSSTREIIFQTNEHYVSEEDPSTSPLNTPTTTTTTTIQDLSHMVRKKKDKLPSSTGTTTTTTPNRNPPPNGTTAASTATLSPRAATNTTPSPHHIQSLSTPGSSVPVARFSPCGSFLVAGTEDGSCILYQKQINNNNTSFFTAVHTSQGHALDILHLEWLLLTSHNKNNHTTTHPTVLAWVSSSLDRTTPLVVWNWNVRRQTVTRQVISTQGRIVRGLALDPAGSYLATVILDQDHHCVQIWQCNHHNDSTATTTGTTLTTPCLQEISIPKVTTTFTTKIGLSWSTDGSYLLVPGCKQSNKDVALILQRQEWKIQASLIGHKHSIVICQHAPKLWQDENPGGAYAHLVAMGDKSGYLTVWSTHQTRPIFRIQCSESRSTITDLRWKISDTQATLLVTLLEGKVVLVRFRVPDEMGPFLTAEQQAQVFQKQYGIDGNKKSSGFVENTLQLQMEEESMSEEEEQEEEETNGTGPAEATTNNTQVNQLSTNMIRKKKDKRTTSNDDETNKVTKKQKASTEAPRIAIPQSTTTANRAPSSPNPMQSPPRTLRQEESSAASTHPYYTPPFVIPHSLAKSYSYEHVFPQSTVVRVECRNKEAPTLAEVNLTIQGKNTWKDHLPSATCCAFVTSKDFIGLGFTDGSIQLYASSPSMGLQSGIAFRSHPLLILGSPIVSICLSESRKLVVLCADATFYVYTMDTTYLKLVLKGTVKTAINHLSLASEQSSPSPTVSKLQMTETGKILLILSTSRGSKSPTENSGALAGSLHAFVYDTNTQLWLKVSDGRFALSDFYESSLSSNSNPTTDLSKIDQRVGFGSRNSSNTSTSRQPGNHAVNGLVRGLEKDNGSFLPTRSHCEDRLACSVVLESKDDFLFWLRHYARVLAVCGCGDHLRVVVDMLMYEMVPSTTAEASNPGQWLFSGLKSFDFDAKTVIRDIVIPEMTKNRSLQRLTNEFLLETR